MMFKKILIIIFIAFNILAVGYLIRDNPTLPDLINSVKSDLPGDTVQIPNVSAYFTNMTRTEVMNFIKLITTDSLESILTILQKEAKEIIVNTIPSYYFEEFILPFRGSLYVNGFEWESDVFTKPENRVKNKLIFKEKEYKSKITIREFPVSIPRRLISFFFTEISIIIIFYLIKSAYKK